MDTDTTTSEVFQVQAEFCKCLADPKRLMIIHELRLGEKSVSELSGSLGLKQSNTSQHLAVLRNAGIVEARREGSLVFYKLVSEKIAQACDLVREVIATHLQKRQLLVKDLRQVK
ncbi:MAG: metalloregulator ArsR/SmtB family transcription factor [Chloroflexota bacterium]|nr:metalloregulator ArsR/SmtB family transcription factor [Chloroflexota bacterium]